MTSADPERADVAGLPRRGVGLDILSSDTDLLFCDVWGVVHNGERFYTEAIDALTRFRARGGNVILVTEALVLESQIRAAPRSRCCC